MRGAVEAVAADAVILVPMPGDRVQLAAQRRAAVEGRLETADARRPRRHPGELADRRHVGRVVRRRQAEEVLHTADDVVIQFDDAGDGTGVDGLEADGVEVLDRRQRTAVGEASQRLVDGGGVVG